MKMGKKVGKVVLDASVLVKWFIDEDDDEKPGLLLEAVKNNQLQLVLPDLALAEVANAIRFDRTYLEGECQQIIAQLLELDPVIVALQNVIPTAVSFVYQSKLTVYDALYVAVAEDFDIPLITADYKHHRQEISKNILWLSTLDLRHLLR